MAEIAVRPQSRKGLLIWMIVSQLLTVGSLLIWMPWIWPLAYTFSYGMAAEAWMLAIIVILLLTSLVVPVVLVIAAWIAYTHRKDRRAGVLSGLSFAPPILLYIFLWASSLIWTLQNGL